MFVITSNMPACVECEDLPAASDFEDVVDLLVDEMNRHVDDLAEAFGADAPVVKDAELLMLEGVAEAKVEPGEIVEPSGLTVTSRRNFSIIIEEF